MSRIIFLDIDGPMISSRCRFLTKPKHVEVPWGQQTKRVFATFDPCAVGLLNRLISLSGAKLVMSSSWAMAMNKAMIRRVLKINGIDPKHLHKDWITPRKMSSYRVNEIKWWLDDHPDVVDYVAIDDADLDIEWVPKCVKCDEHEGFSWRNFLECCVHLDAYDKPEEDRNKTRELYLSTIEYYKKCEIWRTKRSREDGQYLTWEAADLVFPKNPPNKDPE